MFLYHRHILACLHFNKNVNRETKMSDDGRQYFSVTYPKFKLGDEVVRPMSMPPTYGMLHTFNFVFWLIYFFI